MSSSLNHLAPTDQSPILPDGSFGEQSGISEHVAQILNLIPDEQRQELDLQLHSLNQSANNLRTAVETYLQVQSKYNFRDYARRLLMPTEEVLSILEKEILQKNGVINLLGQAFYDYINSISNANL